MVEAHYVCGVAELEGVVGKRPSGAHLKSITYLDEHCATLLTVATFGIVGVRAGSGAIRAAAVGGPAGCMQIADRVTLELPSAVADAEGAAGLLALVPGYRETLRVNGRLGSDKRLHVEEAFLHCAKAMIRSRFWDAPADAVARATVPPTSAVSGEARAFLARSPFVAVASVDANGNADVSPKGDPPGFVHVLDERTLAIPDRPGNHRTDTMHNLVEQPEIGILALVPGDERALEVRGSARVTDDNTIRAAMAVNDKVPAAALVVDVARVELRLEPAIGAAGLWNPEHHVAAGSLPRSSQIWTDHVRRNEDPGLAAKAMRKLANEKVLAAGLRRDYRENLY